MSGSKPSIYLHIFPPNWNTCRFWQTKCHKEVILTSTTRRKRTNGSLLTLSRLLYLIDVNGKWYTQFSQGSAATNLRGGGSFSSRIIHFRIQQYNGDLCLLKRHGFLTHQLYILSINVAEVDVLSRIQIWGRNYGENAMWSAPWVACRFFSGTAPTYIPTYICRFSK